MHDYRKFKVSVNGEDRSHSPPFRTASKVRYVKSRLTGKRGGGQRLQTSPAFASLLQAVRDAGANNVVILGAWRTRATSRSGRAW
jgi:hypothetical protein